MCNSVNFFVNELCRTYQRPPDVRNRSETAYSETANQRVPIRSFPETWIFRLDKVIDHLGVCRAQRLVRARCALGPGGVARRQVWASGFFLWDRPPFSPPLLPASHSSFPQHRLSHAQSSWCVTGYPRSGLADWIARLCGRLNDESAHRENWPFSECEALDVDACENHFWHDFEGHLGMLLSLAACGGEMSGPKDFVALF